MDFDRLPAVSILHTQAEEATTWVITHNLGIYPIVDCFKNHDGQVLKIIPKSITRIDADTCHVEFTQPTSGYAKVT